MVLMPGREASTRARTREVKKGVVAPWRGVRKSRDRVVRLLDVRRGCEGGKERPSLPSLSSN
jgi:hypothetical protein